MIDLVAKSAAAGLLPKTVGGLTLTEAPFQTVYSVAPFKAARPKGFPAVGKSVAYSGGTLMWSARGQYLLVGGTVPDMRAAATDQSDAWCTVRLTGAQASDVLARLCPLETRGMADGDVARSLLGHMTALILRESDGFRLMVFRAFAKTLVHEVTDAMTALEARQNISD